MLRFPKFSPIADYKHLSPNIIEWRRGWNAMGGAIEKMKKILEGRSDPFTSDDFVIIYNTVYTMCIQNPPFDYSQKLYDKYKEAFEEYIRSTVLPSLRRKHDEPLLRELVKRWTNNNTMVRWLSAFFLYLDGYFIPSRSLPSLKEVGLTCFRELVYEETKGKAREAVIALIDREREREQIDRALLKSVIGIYVEIGMGKMDYYVQDFETYMLTDTAAYYSRKASSWIVEDSLPDYILKAGDCLRKEKERVLNYLHASSEPKLLENVQNELLVVYSSRFVEKEAEEHSGFLTLLRDDKVEDITRMFRPFYQRTKGPDPVANTFKQELTQRKASMVYCSCGLEAVVRTSWTLKNPGRRFYGCPNEGWRCRFVGWIDPEVSERESHIIKELLRSGNMVEEEVEASRKEIREETARWKKYLLLSWIGFVGILAASK